jgi:hypothetical protein
MACWLFTTGKDGTSAQSLKRAQEVGSYQTVWHMLHRLRSALVRPGRERLSGVVEVGETYIGASSRGWPVAGPMERRPSRASRWESTVRRRSAGAGCGS